MLRSALGLFVALPLCVQAQPSDELLLAARSPDGLVRFVNTQTGFDWQVLWDFLGVKGMDRLMPCSTTGPDGPRACSAELVRIGEQEQAVVVLRNSFSELVYLRFRSTGPNEWRCDGAYATFLHYYEPRFNVFLFSGKPFLALNEQGAYGTGIGSEIEIWFDLTAAIFEPAFQFAAQAHENRYGFGIGRDIRTSATETREGIQVRSVVDYYIGGDSDQAARREYSAVYTRAPGQIAFQFDAARSSTSHANYSKFIDLTNTPANADLFEEIFPELRVIAAGPENEQREWLENVLNFCEDSSRCDELRILLSKK